MDWKCRAIVMAALVLAPALQSLPADAAEPVIDPAVLTEGFLAAHPDLRWRAEGVRASQAMIAAMYWDGTGVVRDRPIAYAWMDLAAERMYHDFLLYREAYWNALDAGERADRHGDRRGRHECRAGQGEDRAPGRE